MPIDCTVGKTTKGTRFVRSTSYGLISATEAADFMKRLSAEWSSHYLISLIKKDASFPAETRKVFVQPQGGNGAKGAQATAVVFESAIQRAAVATIMLFVTLPEDRPMKTFGTEAEAIAWIDQLDAARSAARPTAAP